MPRQIDSSLLQAKVTNSPTSSISSAGVQSILNSGIAGIPELGIELIEQAVTSLLTDIQQVTGLDLQLLAQLLQGLFSGSENVVADFLSAFSTLLTTATSLTGSIQDLWGQVQNFGGLILQVIQELEETPILLPEQLLGAIWFWVGGLWSTVQQGVSTSNPAVAAHDTRLAAVEAAVLALGQPSRTDNFGNPSLPNWAAISTYPLIQVGTGDYYIQSSSAFRAGQFTESVPATGKYRVQAAVTDLGYGRSRLIFQANSGFTNFVAIELSRTNFFATISIGTASSLTATLTVQDSYSIATGGFKDADVLYGEAVEATNTYTALYNNTPVATWVDGAATIGTGSGHRNLGLCTNISGNATFPGCGWAVFAQADIT